jgi:hypothetical protein
MHAKIGLPLNASRLNSNTISIYPAHIRYDIPEQTLMSNSFFKNPVLLAWIMLCISIGRAGETKFD